MSDVSRVQKEVIEVELFMDMRASFEVPNMIFVSGNQRMLERPVSTTRNGRFNVNQ